MTAPDAPTTAPPATLTHAATSDALDRAAVVRWWQTTSLLRVSGPDALTLLDGLCTQAVERIGVGTAVLGLFLDAKAKLIAPATLHRTADEAWPDPRTAESHPDAPALLLETLPKLVEPLRAHLSRYRLRAKVKIEATELSTVALVGDALVDAAPGALPLRELADLPIEGSWTIVHGQARPTIAFLGTADACAELVAAAADDGFALADPDALEADRILRGIEGLHDLLPGRMPAEIGGMRSAVALDAGCYLGQEPVARLHYRGHANRTLRGLRAEGGGAPAAPPLDEDGTPDLDAALALRRLDDDETTRPVGRLTTWARLEDGSTVALAVLRRELTSGDSLRLAGTDCVLTPVDDGAADTDDGAPADT